MYHKILVPIDGSAHSAYTLTQAVQLAKSLASASVTVLNVVNYNIPGANLIPEYKTIVDNESAALLQKADGQMTDVSFHHDVLSLSGNPAEIICRYASEHSYDLIVIGSSGHGDLSGVLMGSVAHKILIHSSLPVLMIRPSLPEAM